MQPVFSTGPIKIKALVKYAVLFLGDSTIMSSGATFLFRLYTFTVPMQRLDCEYGRI